MTCGSASTVTVGVKRGYQTSNTLAACILVLCPHCGAEQPSPKDGTILWSPAEVSDNQGDRTCNDCDEEYVLHFHSKINVEPSS